MAPAPIFSRTGCYVGVHAGVGAMRNSVAGPSMEIGSDFPDGTGSVHTDKEIFKIGANYLFGCARAGRHGGGISSVCCVCARRPRLALTLFQRG